MMPDVAGRKVLCLAASGGQQSAAFGLMGAVVTVVDISDVQLEKDRATATHYGLTIRTIQQDMQDLSQFPDEEFDIVWHAHSINFVPKARAVISHVGRVCRHHGMLRLEFTNPYVHGAWNCYKDGAFLLSQPYADGAEVSDADPMWNFRTSDGKDHAVRGPKEFRHSMSTIVNGLVEAGFHILGLWEDVGTEETFRPGSWAHFKSIAPPFLTVWARRK
jgi:ubiquinone/menaquinone biosynthesis C-methylase UbiE